MNSDTIAQPRPSQPAGAPKPSHEREQLAHYATTTTIFNLGLALLMFNLVRCRKVPERVPAQDMLLMGLATHQLTRTIAKDRATMPLRAPFTTFERASGSGEVEEEPRGRGFQHVIGELLSCPFCLGPWIASALVGGYCMQPKITRLVCTLFGTVAISDWLNEAYCALKQASDDQKTSG